MKLNPTASEILYSTYLGGSGDDGASDVKVDADGFIYLTGYTQSPDFPVKSPLQPFRGGGALNRDLFVAKISPSGGLVYSTPWGGSENEYVCRVAAAGNGGVYVCGSTQSTDFPVQNAFQPKYGGGFDDGVFALIADSTPIAPSPLTPSPAVLSFSYTQGAAAPSAQTVTITGGTFVASSSTAWLSWTTQAGSVGVTVTPANLAPGTYNGTLTVTPSSGTPATVAVTLVVFAPAPVLTSLNPSFITAGSSDTIITLNGSGFTANTSALLEGEGWTTTPIQFVNTSTLTFDMPPSVLSGVFTWSIAVQNPQTQPSNPLSLNVGVAVENAASYRQRTGRAGRNRDHLRIGLERSRDLRWHCGYRILPVADADRCDCAVHSRRPDDNAANWICGADQSGCSALRAGDLRGGGGRGWRAHAVCHRLRRAHEGYAAALPASGIGDGEWSTGSSAVRRHRTGAGFGSESDQFAASERHHERPDQYRGYGRHCVEQGVFIYTAMTACRSMRPIKSCTVHP